MKSLGSVGGEATDEVAPLTGAWIEIRNGSRSAGTLGVAPLAGAWIEIAVRAVDFEDAGGSPPSRGAWIEMPVLAL